MTQIRPNVVFFLKHHKAQSSTRMPGSCRSPLKVEKVSCKRWIPLICFASQGKPTANCPFLYGCQWKANASLMRMIHIIRWFHNVISLLCDHKMKLWTTSPVHMDHFHTSCCVWIWYLLKATSIRCVNMIHSAVTVYALSRTSSPSP